MHISVAYNTSKTYARILLLMRWFSLGLPRAHPLASLVRLDAVATAMVQGGLRPNRQSVGQALWMAVCVVDLTRLG